MDFTGLLVTVLCLVSSACALWVPYADLDSCADAGRCGSSPNPTYNCQCNTQCETYGDCCKDYHYICLGAEYSCQQRCGQDYNPSDTCHCNSLCQDYNNCCGDYNVYCFSGPITPQELSALADNLWESDTSKADPSEYTINKQTKVPDGNYVDRASQKLFTSVNEAAVFSRPTFAAFISLIDNYNPKYGVNEVVTPGEQAELQHFLDVVMATKVMTIAANFAVTKGLVTDAAAWRAEVEKAWFTLYDRSSPTDSSGFEHVYLGEYKSGNSVNGFHNWVQFYFLEKSGDLNYYGYVRDDVATNMIGANFNWNGYTKTMGSFMYGASPEFELAMMSTCFIAFPGEFCSFDLNGNNLGIQTYPMMNDYVGSAYFGV